VPVVPLFPNFNKSEGVRKLPRSCVGYSPLNIAEQSFMRLSPQPMESAAAAPTPRTTTFDHVSNLEMGRIGMHPALPALSRQLKVDRANLLGPGAAVME
jgi:hypothetical protein